MRHVIVTKNEIWFNAALAIQYFPENTTALHGVQSVLSDSIITEQY